jgi:hypothetical protein
MYLGCDQKKYGIDEFAERVLNEMAPALIDLKTTGLSFSPTRVSFSLWKSSNCLADSLILAFAAQN